MRVRDSWRKVSASSPYFDCGRPVLVEPDFAGEAKSTEVEAGYRAGWLDGARWLAATVLSGPANPTSISRRCVGMAFVLRDPLVRAKSQEELAMDLGISPASVSRLLQALAAEFEALKPWR